MSDSVPATIVFGALTFAAHSGWVAVLAEPKANSHGPTSMAGFLEAHERI
jgi:hypothetical protein